MRVSPSRGSGTGPLFFAGLLFLACGRLKTRARSSRLLNKLKLQQRSLQQRRADVERKMRRLTELEGAVAWWDSDCGEVWGPADHRQTTVPKYRRFWLERPKHFPMRKDEEDVSSNQQLAARPGILRG